MRKAGLKRVDIIKNSKKNKNWTQHHINTPSYHVNLKVYKFWLLVNNICQETLSMAWTKKSLKFTKIYALIMFVALLTFAQRTRSQI